MRVPITKDLPFKTPITQAISILQVEKIDLILEKLCVNIIADKKTMDAYVDAYADYVLDSVPRTFQYALNSLVLFGEPDKNGFLGILASDAKDYIIRSTRYHSRPTAKMILKIYEGIRPEFRTNVEWFFSVTTADKLRKYLPHLFTNDCFADKKYNIMDGMNKHILLMDPKQYIVAKKHPLNIEHSCEQNLLRFVKRFAGHPLYKKSEIDGKYYAAASATRPTIFELIGDFFRKIFRC
jgi:hypothetical protein